MWRRGFHSSSPVFAEDSYYDLDAMIDFFHSGYSTSPAMVIAMPGVGAQYLGAVSDSNNENLDGARSYRLHIPPDVPVLNYWSVTVYDADTSSLLDSGHGLPSVTSNDNLQLNADGSATIAFGPEPPDDGTTNWIATVPGRGFLVTIRLYSPTEAFFDKTWRPGNIDPA